MRIARSLTVFPGSLSSWGGGGGAQVWPGGCGGQFWPVGGGGVTSPSHQTMWPIPWCIGCHQPPPPPPPIEQSEWHTFARFATRAVIDADKLSIQLITGWHWNQIAKLENMYYLSITNSITQM